LHKTVVPSRHFDEIIGKRSGQSLNQCYQCHKCTNGCPVTSVMDLMPHQVVRYIQLGLENDLLQCKTIWQCAACRTCVSRCPNGIDIAALNDTLKQLAIAQGVKPALPEIAAFHHAFLNSVKSRGRVHELGMMIVYKLKTGTYFQDASLGIKMLRRNKLRLISEGIKNRRRFQLLLQRKKEGQP